MRPKHRCIPKILHDPKTLRTLYLEASPRLVQAHGTTRKLHETQRGWGPVSFLKRKSAPQPWPTDPFPTPPTPPSHWPHSIPNVVCEEFRHRNSRSGCAIAFTITVLRSCNPFFLTVVRRRTSQSSLDP